VSHYGRPQQRASGYGENTEVSGLFEGFPDVNAIKQRINNVSWRTLEPYLKSVVRDAQEFPKGWDSEKIFKNSVILSAYLVVEGLRTNQVRKILEMARITELKSKRGDTNIKDDIMKMHYLLAYTVGRATGSSKHALEAFYSVLEPMLRNLMEDPKAFPKFFEFLQSVVAYHRFFGGRE